MIFRLSVVTSVMVLFAISFSTLVTRDRESHGTLLTATQGCYEKGAVCVR